MSNISASTTAQTSLTKTPLIGLGKESRTIVKEYPVIALSNEAYDWLCKQSSRGYGVSGSTTGRYSTSKGFIIYVGQAAEKVSRSHYETRNPEVFVLMANTFRGKRVVLDETFIGYEDLIKDWHLVREAFAEVAQKMREESKQQDIFVGTDLL